MSFTYAKIAQGDVELTDAIKQSSRENPNADLWDNKWLITNGHNQMLHHPFVFGKEKERDFVKQVNDELIERVIGQGIFLLSY